MSHIRLWTCEDKLEQGRIKIFTKGIEGTWAPGGKYAFLLGRSTCPLLCVKITLAIVPYRIVGTTKAIIFRYVEAILDISHDPSINESDKHTSANSSSIAFYIYTCRESYMYTHLYNQTFYWVPSYNNFYYKSNKDDSV